MLPDRVSAPARTTWAFSHPAGAGGEGGGGAAAGGGVGAAGADGGSGPFTVSKVRLLRSRISASGWKKVTPPTVQLPDPPEVTPCAWLPDIHGPPESPGSAHTFVRVRPETAPSG